MTLSFILEPTCTLTAHSNVKQAALDGAKEKNPSNTSLETTTLKSGDIIMQNKLLVVGVLGSLLCGSMATQAVASSFPVLASGCSLTGTSGDYPIFTCTRGATLPLTMVHNLTYIPVWGKLFWFDLYNGGSKFLFSVMDPNKQGLPDCPLPSSSGEGTCYASAYCQGGHWEQNLSSSLKCV